MGCWNEMFTFATMSSVIAIKLENVTLSFGAVLDGVSNDSPEN